MEEPQQIYVRQVDNSVMSIKDWLITMLITAIPLVGIIMLFVWAFGDGTNQNKANYAKASLIWLVIVALIGMILVFMFFGLILGSTNEISRGLQEMENMN